MAKVKPFTAKLNLETQMITIREASPADISIIQQIAYGSWPSTYGEILSKEQLDYMLDKFYDSDALLDLMINQWHFFILIYEDDFCLGFASFEHHYLNQKTTRLHKIYLLPEAQGKGAGKLLVGAVVDFAKKNDSDAVSLNVNRFNKACSFYQKMGFEIIGEEDIELDHGFLMEDYKMEKKLN